ncbi:MAG: Lrp/AsnC family transcriptional regulator [Anaerolineae bacterium]|nr:Lrp/AsnC family transcriptional regulator [Anaerolineae bacterium]
MLDKLLRILSEGGTYSPSDLSRKLDVGEELVREMIAGLVRLGYLGSLAASCAQNCGRCAQSTVCSVSVRGQAWTLTEDGKRAARRIHDSRR